MIKFKAQPTTDVKKKMRVLLPANPEQPGFLMACNHPSHGPCMIHVGNGTEIEIAAAMKRCGIGPVGAGQSNDGITVVVAQARDGLAYRVRGRRRRQQGGMTPCP